MESWSDEKTDSNRLQRFGFLHHSNTPVLRYSKAPHSRELQAIGVALTP
jgi:hypothetical protein